MQEMNQGIKEDNAATMHFFFPSRHKMSSVSNLRSHLGKFYKEKWTEFRKFIF